MHAPKKLVSRGYWLWWPTSLSCMACVGSIFGLSAVSRIIMAGVFTVCHKKADRHARKVNRLIE